MRHALLALGSFVAVSAPAAHAAYTTITYTGTVSDVHAATSGPQGPSDILLGTPVTFSATFDPSKEIARPTIYNIDVLTGRPLALDIRTVTFYGDPLASYTITVASHVFTSADDIYHGLDIGENTGPFPFLAFSGTQLLGLEINSEVDGFHFYSSVGSYLLQVNDNVGYGFYEADGDYYYAVDTSLDGAIDAARVYAVPEPSSWALMLAGISGVAWSRRRATRSALPRPSEAGRCAP